MQSQNPVIKQEKNAWIASISAPERVFADEVRLRYVKSYLLLRLIVGSIGFALPPALLLADWWLGHSRILRGSLSAYYHSGARDIFTCSLCAIGVALITYKAFEKTIENYATLGAGLAAIVVAVVPTKHSCDSIPTLLQEQLGEDRAKHIHLAAAAIFIALLAVISFLFAKKESNRSPDQWTQYPKRWAKLHIACSVVMVVALLAAGITAFREPESETGNSTHGIWIAEVVCILAFSASWFCKGVELHRLLDHDDEYLLAPEGNASNAPIPHPTKHLPNSLRTPLNGSCEATVERFPGNSISEMQVL